MARTSILIGVSTLLASAALGCSGAPVTGPYPAIAITERADPMAGERTFTPWRPPRQMAAFVPPHEDLEQGVMIAGHWIMVLLGEGSWYFQEDPDRDPLPDAEASAEEIRKGLGAISVPRDAVIPYRVKDGAKP